MLHNKLIWSNLEIYLTNKAELIQYLGIHDTIQYLNSKFETKPLSEVRIRIKLVSVVITVNERRSLWLLLYKVAVFLNMMKKTLYQYEFLINVNLHECLV